MWERPSFSTLEQSLLEPSNPIGMRMRAAYHLRQEHDESGFPPDDAAGAVDRRQRQEDVVRVLSVGLLDKRQGSLLRHELAYVMGQIRDESCCPCLENVLADQGDCVMVRHECAEALGAVGADRSRAVLERVMKQEGNDNPLELTDTCRLALAMMNWREAGDEDEKEMPVGCACMLSPYSSVDPAPPHPAHENKTEEELGDILLSADAGLFERYRAMFSLRNRGGRASVLQLCRALTQDETSALLRHEVAYVLGQMQHAAAVPALEESLGRKHEHTMVRHESAEALGAIEGCWDRVETVLQKFCEDEDEVVRDSCLVALDAANYWGRNQATPEGTGLENEDEKKTVASFADQKAERRTALNAHFNVQV
jgi:deoxyhypusine monooxygenase